jgi:phytanoyl-CoA hydroxylase
MTMNRTLTQEELERYDRDGYLVIEDAVPAARLAEVIAETERMYNVAYTITDGTSMLDVDPAHTPEIPRVRRIKSQHEHSDFFHDFAGEPLIMDLLDPIMPSGIRVHNTKINMKSAEVGESIEWHQDWAFYPHTNDDVLAIGIYLDDCTEENGPMMVVPGSHKGETYNHHADGYFCGAIDPAELDGEIEKAVPLTGPAGTLTIHHARLLHGSAFNRSDKGRRFLLQAYAAADAWPLADLKGGLASFNDKLVRGEPTWEPRMESPPVRIPLPLRPDVIVGSIYDNQSVLKNRFYDDETEEQRKAVAG